MELPLVLMTLCLGAGLWVGCHGPAGKGDGDTTFNPPVAVLTSVQVSTQL